METSAFLIGRLSHNPATFSICFTPVPADASSTRHRLLKAAAKLFAAHGYDGASMRAIAAEGRSQLALLHYHFGSKEDLYRAVWENHYAAAAEARRIILEKIDYSCPREEVLRELVHGFLEAPMKMTLDPQGRLFSRIVAREANDPNEPEHGILKDYLDPTARLLIAGLARAMPELRSAELAWGYQAMAGIVTAYLADSGRAARLSNNAVKSGDFHDAFPRLLEFIVGGWLGLVSANSGASAPTRTRTRKGSILNRAARRLRLGK